MPNLPKLSTEGLEGRTAKQMTLADMRKLSNDLNNLSGNQAGTAMQILKRREPEFVASSPNRMNFAFAEQRTLRALRKYVDKIKAKKSENS
ncbi:bromodomain testis-specific protein-like [Oratosquilla oratoria]|uniref:bromodomain testis-specific protein-like n=1 Tax=Oratosquilla oratoria TaxID=337810 RepID=UPI003F770707